MSRTRKGETEKERCAKFARFCADIPHDSATLVQHKKEIADALGVPDTEVKTKMVGKLKTIIKDLRDPDTFAIVRDPRLTWFYIHQVWKNCHVIRKHAAAIREKLNLVPSAEPTGDEPVALRELTGTVDGNGAISDVSEPAEEASWEQDFYDAYYKIRSGINEPVAGSEDEFFQFSDDF